MKVLLANICVIASLLFAVVCSDNPVNYSYYLEEFYFGDTVNISFGSRVISIDGHIEVGFTDVMSDGRCPANDYIRCFWEGNAEVKLYMEQDHHTTKFELNTFSGFRNDTTITNINIKLVRLLPLPDSELPVPKKQYWAELVITRSE